MTRIENHTISPLKKLIDVNGQLTNFKVDFMVRCKNEIKPFKIALVDQNILDNGDKINWKVVSDGGLKGSYVYDKGIFTNHYIYLKSNDQINVEVRLNVVPLDEEKPPQPPVLQRQAEQENQEEPEKKNKEPFYKSWFFIGFCLVLFVCVIIYFFWNNKKDETNTKSDNTIDLDNKDESNEDKADKENSKERDDEKEDKITLDDFMTNARKNISKNNITSKVSSNASSKASSKAGSKAGSNVSSKNSSPTSSPEKEADSPVIDFRTKDSSKDKGKKLGDYNFGF